MYGQRCIDLGALGIAWMQSYSDLIAKCMELRINMFMQMPKLHMLMHSWRELYDNGVKLGIGINPLAEAVPMSEDFIGRVSRQSRRVSHRKVMLRTLNVHAIKLRKVWDDA